MRQSLLTIDGDKLAMCTRTSQRHGYYYPEFTFSRISAKTQDGQRHAYQTSRTPSDRGCNLFDRLRRKKTIIAFWRNPNQRSPGQGSHPIVQIVPGDRGVLRLGRSQHLITIGLSLLGKERLQHLLHNRTLGPAPLPCPFTALSGSRCSLRSGLLLLRLVRPRWLGLAAA